MTLHFTKMEGLGNDYIYIDCINHMPDDPAGLAGSLSDRHYGIGSDGLILIRSSECADFMMDMYNADGSRSEMCGNGIRCVGKYVYEHNLTNKTGLTIETLSGVKYLKLLTDEKGVREVTVNMGTPILNPDHIPVLFGASDVICNETYVLDGNAYVISCVSMGNPHCILFADDIESIKLEELGPRIENAEIFPNRTNVSFVQIIDMKHIRMRVWERGTGETLACGTAACAALVACVLNGRTERSINASLKGGNLVVRWDEDNNCIYMTGPANTVYEGVIHI